MSTEVEQFEPPKVDLVYFRTEGDTGFKMFPLCEIVGADIVNLIPRGLNKDGAKCFDVELQFAEEQKTTNMTGSKFTELLREQLSCGIIMSLFVQRASEYTGSQII